MSKFIELSGEESGLDLTGNPPATADFVNDDETMSLNDQDIELGAVAGSASQKSGARTAANIKGYIKQKTADISNFKPSEYIQTKKQQVQAFSLEEFNAKNRSVMIRAALGEVTVTAMFMFIVCAVGLNTNRAGHKDSEMMIVSAVCTGFSAVALIYSFADVSGAHFNPAVTFATIVTGKTTIAKGLSFIAAQIVGSLIAMAALASCFPPLLNPDGSILMTVPQELLVTPSDTVYVFRPFLIEIILSFILVYVIFATAFDTVESTTAVRVLDDQGNAVDSKHRKNAMTIYTTSGASKSGFAPLSIGFTLGFLCFLGGSVSGGAFNPARVFMAQLTSWNFNYFWLYWFGDFIGAACAGLLHQRVFASSLVKNPQK